MNFDEYQKLAMRTANDKSDLINAALGISGEAGECTDIVKKYVYHGHTLDSDELKKELGDVMWYIALFCDKLGTTMEDVAIGNISKLAKRYPDGFSEFNSINRPTDDTDEERKGGIGSTGAV